MDPISWLVAIVVAVNLFTAAPQQQVVQSEAPVVAVVVQGKGDPAVVETEETTPAVSGVPVVEQAEVARPTAIEKFSLSGIGESGSNLDNETPSVASEMTSEQGVTAKKADVPLSEKVLRAAQKKQTNPTPVLGEALSTSPQNMKKAIYVAHFNNFAEAMTGKPGAWVEVVEQGRLNPLGLTVNNPDVPTVCRSDKRGVSDGFCVAEAFFQAAGKPVEMVEVEDYMNFARALSGGIGGNRRMIPRAWFNPKGETARDANGPVTCILLKKGGPKNVCIDARFIVATASP